jgi:hypothetical protein
MATERCHSKEQDDILRSNKIISHGIMNFQDPKYDIFAFIFYTNVYPKVSGMAAWSENCKWYNSLPQVAVVSLLCESV